MNNLFKRVNDNVTAMSKQLTGGKYKMNKPAKPIFATVRFNTASGLRLLTVPKHSGLEPGDVVRLIKVE